MAKNLPESVAIHRELLGFVLLCATLEGDAAVMRMAQNLKRRSARLTVLGELNLFEISWVDRIVPGNINNNDNLALA